MASFNWKIWKFQLIWKKNSKIPGFKKINTVERIFNTEYELAVSV